MGQSDSVGGGSVEPKSAFQEEEKVESGFSPLINFVDMLKRKNYDCSHNCNQ